MGAGRYLSAVRSLIVILSFALFPGSGAAGSGLDSLLHILPDQQGKEKAITLGNIAYTVSLGDPLRAKGYAQQALELAVSLKDSALIGSVVNDLALIEHRLGHFHEAVALNRRALRIRRMLADTMGIASSHSKLGAAWVELYQFDSALVHNQAAERVYHELGDVVREAMIRGNSARLYDQMGDHDMAESVAREAMRMLNDQPMGYAKANSMGQLATLLAERSKDDEALMHARKALVAYAAVGMPSEQASMANIIGSVMRERADADSALFWFKEAQRLAELGNDVSGQATYLANMADMYAERGERDRAIELYEQAIAISRSERYVDQLAWALQRIVPLYKASGRVAEALRSHEEMVVLRDSIYQREKVHALSEMQVKYETERTENDLLEAQARTERQQQQLEQQRFRILGLGAGLVVLLFLGFLLVRVQRLRHKAQLSAGVIAEREQGLKAIVQRTDAERKRIAAELHDGVGQLLTVLKHRAEAASVNDPGLGGVLQLAEEAGREVRDIAHRMMPRALSEVGLVPALTDMLNKSLVLPGVVHTFEHHGMEQRLSAEVETGVYRIAQELVNNIMKHAQAKHVDVQLLRNNGALILIVEDDGIGIDPALARRGLGMLNLQDRARILHGTIELSANSPHGTTATLRIADPAQQAA